MVIFGSQWKGRALLLGQICNSRALSYFLLLCAKQGRGSQFTSKHERDLWIQNELKALKKNIQDKNIQIKNLKEELAKQDKDRKEHEAKINVKYISYLKLIINIKYFKFL